MDTYYRKFQKHFYNALLNPNEKLDDLIKSVKDRAEGIYKNWFLDKLLENWENIAGKDLEEYGYIPEINRQIDFYRDNIKNAKGRTYVIISDAMRYEVGVELSNKLKKDIQCKVEMKNMEGIFPTITPFGMAALLPNNGLTTEIRNDSLKVLIDGEYTDSNYREKILKKANENSVVLKSEDFKKLKRDERKESVKGKDVVYIYHDKIDSASHHSDEVAAACEDAIIDLESLVKLISNDYPGSNIIITSDHGFIYTHEVLEEVDKISKIGFKDVVEVERRYAIMSDKADPEFLMPVKFIDENAGLKGFAPRENIRIKKQGGGTNFVHGGISLQEMVVPLISYKHLRNNNTEYLKNKNNIDVKPVELKLLSLSRKISNMIFNLSFYQTEMVSEIRSATSFTAYFVDENNEKISDEVKIIADRDNSNDEQDRRFDVRFNLKQRKYDNKKVYYLLIVEDSNKVIPERVEFNIDIPFAIDEYDFFS